MIGLVTRALVMVAILAAAGQADPEPDPTGLRAAAEVMRTSEARARKPLLDRLVAAGHLTAVAAARVPAPKQIAVQMRRLAPELKQPSCKLRLDTGTEEVDLDCLWLEKADCGYDTVRVATIRIGARWTASDRAQKKRPNDLCDF